MLGSVQLTLPAEELEDGERQSFGQGRGTLAASTMDKPVKPVLLMATNP